jgi:hypothetical protein
VTIRAKDDGKGATTRWVMTSVNSRMPPVFSRWSGSTKVVSDRLPLDIGDAPLAEAAERSAAQFKLTSRVGKRPIRFRGPTSPTRAVARFQ